MAKSKVIECKGVKKTFARGKLANEVLHGINLEIYAGEYVILFGPSGCGKSTLLNIISGLEPATSGKVNIRGKDITKFNEKELARQHRSRIGMVFQSFNLLKSLTVLENIALPQVFAGARLSRRTRRAENLLKLFEFERFRNYTPNELSGGQQQRVAIARALVNNPWILLVDEPTGNLDSKSAGEVMQLLKDLNERSKRTILLVTHNPDYITHPHRVLYMKDGQIIRTVINRPLGDEIAGPQDINSDDLLQQAAIAEAEVHDEEEVAHATN